MKDILLLLGCWLVLCALAAVLFGRHARRRPYLAARWDDASGWADGTPAATSPADLDALELLWDLPAYSASRERLKKQITSDPYYEATFRRIADDELAPDLADFAERLLEEARGEGDDHTTTNPTGDQT
ncbi:MAG TPA: hypothetical protein VLK35_17390 [Methylomirabilota bacterium]|nr:hypothetical protein [Methylomirabilota bacterium]